MRVVDFRLISKSFCAELAFEGGVTIAAVHRSLEKVKAKK